MKKLFYFSLVIYLAGCKEKYDLPFTPPVTGYLVVEGIISNGPDSTRIQLSRTNNSINSSDRQYEGGAIVVVESEDNNTSQLPEIGTGIYSSSLNLDNTRQYRLRITTLEGKEYLSEFVGVKDTPPIDTIGWDREPAGVRLHLNTHDPQNNTGYYIWDYHETWEFHSTYPSVLKYVRLAGPPGQPNIAIGYKDSTTYSLDTTILKCWQSSASTNILIGSSAKLTNDVIHKQPLLLIPRADIKLSQLYSILVRQYALTKEGYEFLQKMKRNTEENGSIFDPQPSQLKGNISCVTKPAEPVIGFFSIATVESKRIFIYRGQVPDWNYNSYCTEQWISNNPDSIDDAMGAGQMPSQVLEYMPGGGIKYFGVSAPACIDCTLTGTNVRPVFWP